MLTLCVHSYAAGVIEECVACSPPKHIAFKLAKLLHLFATYQHLGRSDLRAPHGAMASSGRSGFDR